MPVTCPKCFAENKSTAKFCSLCGQPLTGLAAVSPPPAAPVSRLQQSSLVSAIQARLCLPDGTNIDLEQQNTIGRDAAQCNLSFPADNRLSRRHARIYEASGEWMLEDLGSSNGTYLNQQPVQQPVKLRSGDQVGLGSLTFIFLLGNGPASGQAIAPAQPSPIIPAIPPVPPATPPINIPFPASPAPAHPPPPGGWRTWNTAPATEGYVNLISARYTMKKNDLLKRGIAAAALALLISPAVAFIPLMQGNDIAARDLRVEDHNLGHMVDVIILGDMMGTINQGDPVAIWGKVQGGLLVMDAGFNYATQTEIRLSKK